jgi:hypothetical protein
MRLSAMTAVTATLLAFTFFQTPQLAAQDSDVGASSRPVPLDGGSSPGSEEQSSNRQSESSERSGAAGSAKSQTGIAETRDTASRGRAHARFRSSFHSRHRIAGHRRSHGFAFNHRRRHLVIHRRGHRIVELNDSRRA